MWDKAKTIQKENKNFNLKGQILFLVNKKINVISQLEKINDLFLKIYKNLKKLRY